MRGIHDRCLCTADACGEPGNYVVGANVAAFTRVADAMLALGMV
jgi:glutamate dehydrogenase (NADP+)